jgi:protein-L-isoaspartate O-methyltransferase
MRHEKVDLLKPEDFQAHHRGVVSVQQSRTPAHIAEQRFRQFGLREVSVRAQLGVEGWDHL